MYFRVEYAISGLNLPPDRDLFFDSDDPKLTLDLTLPTEGTVPRLPKGHSFAILVAERPVTSKVRKQFDLEQKTPAVNDTLGDALVVTREFLSRACNVLRWRTGDTNSNPLISTHSLARSDDGQSWITEPHIIGIAIQRGIPFSQLKPPIQESVCDIVKAGTAEPLGHELFHEAWQLRNSHPRSSLLIGLSAAEVGLKQFISDLVPNAAWLASNVPTPPLIQMLSYYLPTLPVKARFSGLPVFVPKSILEALKDGVRSRNETAHQGKAIKPESLEEILRAVRDLLYLLDVYFGHVWAESTLQFETQQQIAAERSKLKSERG